MAVRARLASPQETQTEWPWHTVESMTLKASSLFDGERRMEAANYLAKGFHTRLKIESMTTGWAYFANVAYASQPSRLKGIQVSEQTGTPFLAATQVYDVRPVARKWLALARTREHASRFVSSGTILVSCSGTVGRATLADSTVDGFLISHDLLRVELRDHSWWGWMYAVPTCSFCERDDDRCEVWSCHQTS